MVINKAKKVKKNPYKAAFRKMLKDVSEVAMNIKHLTSLGVLTIDDRDNLYKALRNDLLAASNKLPLAKEIQ